MAEKSRGLRFEQAHKRVRAYLAGELVADTRRPVLVWEWPYYPTYYFPAADTRAELVPAGRTEHSPSRGEGEVYHVKVAGTGADDAALRYPDSPIEALRDLVHPDIVWIYRAPLPESQKIAGLACFYNEKVDLYTDGKLQERPQTHFG